MIEIVATKYTVQRRIIRLIWFAMLKWNPREAWGREFRWWKQFGRFKETLNLFSMYMNGEEEIRDPIQSSLLLDY